MTGFGVEWRDPNAEPSLRKPARDPLRSSKPALTDGFFLLSGWFGAGKTFDRQMFAASTVHDLCYVHGPYTARLTRALCDRFLTVDAGPLCPLINKPGLHQWGCRSRAAIPYRLVDWFGARTFQDNDFSACDFREGLGPRRDRIVTGRFAEKVNLATLEAESPILLRLAGYAMGIPRSHQTLDLQTIRIVVGHKGKTISFSDTSIVASRFLAREPLIADVDGDTVDDLILFALDDFPDCAGGDRRASVGAVVLVVPGAMGTPSAFQLAPSWKGQQDEVALTCATGDDLVAYRSLIQILDGYIRRAQVFSTGVGAGGKGAEELVAINLDRFRERGLRIDTFSFETDPVGRLISLDVYRALIEHTSPLPHYGCKNSPDTEIYKRLSYPPLMVDRNNDGLTDIAFVFRDRQCETLRTVHVETIFAPDRAFACISEGGNEYREQLDWLGATTCPRAPSGRSHVKLAHSMYRGWTFEGAPYLDVSADSGDRRTTKTLAAIFAANCDRNPNNGNCHTPERLDLMVMDGLSAPVSATENHDVSLLKVEVPDYPWALPAAADPTDSRRLAGEWIYHPVLSGMLGPGGEPGLILTNAAFSQKNPDDLRSVPAVPRWYDRSVASLDFLILHRQAASGPWLASLHTCDLRAFESVGMSGPIGDFIRTAQMVLLPAAPGHRAGIAFAARDQGPSGVIRPIFLDIDNPAQSGCRLHGTTTLKVTTLDEQPKWDGEEYER